MMNVIMKCVIFVRLRSICHGRIPQHQMAPLETSSGHALNSDGSDIGHCAICPIKFRQSIQLVECAAEYSSAFCDPTCNTIHKS